MSLRTRSLGGSINERHRGETTNAATTEIVIVLYDNSNLAVIVGIATRSCLPVNPSADVMLVEHRTPTAKLKPSE